MGGMVAEAVRAVPDRGGAGLWESTVKEPAELLALLTEHGVDVDRIPGGWSEFSALDIAGALGMTHADLGSDLVLAKYTMSATAYRSAKAGWRLRVGNQCLREHWDRGKPGTLVAMADYTLAEWIDPMRCRTCNGADVVIGGLKRTCPACEGTGLREASDRAIARALDLSATGYRNGPWPSRVVWARAEISHIERMTLALLARHARRHA